MNTVSKGLISNIDQYSDPKLLQTNAEITHGSSGGALINEKGEVIGVTSAGDGTKDGARASINFAIWIGELNNLSPINKKSIVDPASIPCQLGFYTNSPYTGSVYLYIDGIYVGSFSKYFQNNYTPTCGDDGTITRYLYSGSHTYKVYYVSLGQWFSGTITLSPGQCKIFKVEGQKSSYNPNNNNDFYDNNDFYGNNIGGYFRKQIDDRGSRKWVIATGFSFLETGGSSFPFPIFVEKYLSDKYSVRANIQWRKRNSDSGYSNSFRYFGVGLDFKKIFPRPYRWNWFVAATCNYRSINIYDITAEVIYQNNGYVTVENIYHENKNHFFSGLRIGSDRYCGEKFYLTWDLGIGYHTFYKIRTYDMNILLGYRF